MRIILKYKTETATLIEGKPFWEATFQKDWDQHKQHGDRIHAGVGKTPEEAIGFLVLGDPRFQVKSVFRDKVGT